MRKRRKRIVTGAKVLIVMLLLPAAGRSESGMRQWTSSTGDSVEAELVRQSGNIVVLEGEDGQQFQILASQLSQEDQVYLREQAAPAAVEMPTIARRSGTTASRMMLTEEQIASLILVDPPDAEPGDRVVRFVASTRARVPTAAQRSRGMIPFRVTADFNEFRGSGDRLTRRRLSGMVRLYVLNEEGEMVDSVSRTVDRMCPG